ncbi:MAG TPA: DPP IV N-terminal domain-containing protein, partial [Gemmataceae bacterium]|nr:DPP IV N-terminal domain-containing protein [Gemmataceae bacterium]
MWIRTRDLRNLSIMAITAAVIGFVPMAISAQDRLKTMPGYDQYQKMAKEYQNLAKDYQGGGKAGKAGKGAAKKGPLSVTWQEGGKSFDYVKDGKKYHYDIATGKTTDLGTAKDELQIDDEPFDQGPMVEALPQQPERGRQYESAVSPDGKRMAFYKDANLWLGDAKGSNAIAVTTEGVDSKRIRFGTASWVYGEELKQNTAMWWSPDSKKIAFYGVDASKVPDYYLPLNQSSLRAEIDAEAYPKPGDPNPVMDVLIYDLASKKTLKVDVRNGQPFSNAVVGHYVYNIRWSPDGKELFFNRTNRKQNTMEFT